MLRFNHPILKFICSKSKIDFLRCDYLANAKNIIVEKKNENISNLKSMTSGIKAGDGGSLILNEIEKEELVKQFPNSKPLIKNYVGADDFMNGGKRFCLWITEENKKTAYSFAPLVKRFEKCRELRLKSKKAATVKKADKPYQFDETTFTNAPAILIPQTGSEKRDYVPIGFINADTIISNAARAIYNPETFLFSVISSRMHIVWVKAVAGRLKTDMQYSNTLCYNTFPFPNITEIQKKELEKHVYKVLAEREAHSEKTLAQLYDPEKMPDGLREAHHQLDLAVEHCYRAKPFETDEERLEYLFKLYEQMIDDENNSGTLFASNPKPKKKNK